MVAVSDFLGLANSIWALAKAPGPASGELHSLVQVDDLHN